MATTAPHKPRAIPQVMVSSTFTDLQNHREELIKSLHRHNLHANAVEYDSPRTVDVIDSSLLMVRDSAAYIAIIGLKYGQIPDDPKRNPQQLSITELEFNEAQRLARPILLFIMGYDHPVKKADIETDPEKEKKLDAFRERVKQVSPDSSVSRVYAVFNSLDEFKMKLVMSLSELSRYLEEPDVGEPTHEGEPTHLAAKREVKIIRLLLSSPGDVTDERECVAHAVFRFNQHAVEDEGLFIKLVRWEDMAPQIGPKAQPVINKQIGRYHMFCGIMWNRFGTPTEIAASGTREEFDGAVDTWEKDGQPWITFYFCDRAANFTTPEQLEQKRMVLEFRTHLNDKGVVRSFHGTQEFEDKVYEDLKRIVKIPEFLNVLNAG